MKRGNVVYLTVVGLLAVMAAVVLTVLCGLDPMLVTVLVMVAVIIFGVVVPGRIAGRRQERVATEAQDTCKPILKRYRKKHSATRLVEDYMTWCAQDHDAQTHVLFSQSVVAALMKDGHFDEAKTVLANGERAAKKARLSKDYRQFVDACEKKMKETDRANR